MNHHQMRQILDQAFRDRAPNAYEEMQHQDELATYLDSLTAEAMQSISTAKDRIPADLATMPQADRNDPIKVVQRANMLTKAAEEVALSQALEAMPLEQTEDEDEPAEPMSLYDLTGDYWREKMQRETAAQPARRATTASSREK